MIEFKNVSKTYDGQKFVLRNLDIKIEDGEFVFIVGHSGAGKTTLTKLLLREEKVTEGRLVIDNFHLEKMRESRVPYLRRTMGVVFQDFRLFPKKTVFENVSFAMQVLGESSKLIKSRVPDFLELVGLSDKSESFPSQLSGGEQQRVALARALVNKPNIIIADEPTGNIDPKLSLDIMEMLVRLNARLGKTVIVVTHERSLVDYFQKRVITLNDGVIESDRIGGMFNEEI
jgi:cell division ATP-binding protein FtsE